MTITRQESDTQLMRRVQAGDLDRLAELYRRHHAGLRGFLFRICGDAAGADDLVQTVFLRILRHRKHFRGQGSFAAWMYRIARNSALDRIKSEKLRSPAPFPRGNNEPRDPHPDAESCARHRERLDILEEAFRRLSRGEREVLSLSKIDGLSGREIAAILGCSAGAVKVRVFRAMGELRRLVRSMENGVLP